MPDLREQFKSCGKNVVIHDHVTINHPHCLEVGDNVTFMAGFHLHDELRIAKIGNNVTFFPNCFIQGSSPLTIEDHVAFYPGAYLSTGNKEQSFIRIAHHSHFAPNVVLYGHGGLTIGPYCNIASHVVLATVGHDHQITNQPMATAPTVNGPITLEEDIWIGANATITANITIAKGCVIGANAVLTHSTAPRGIYLGIPAKKVQGR